MANPVLDPFDATDGPLDAAAETALRKDSPALPYIILFTARSGSTFLTHALQNTHRFGTPHEWFNPSTVSEIAAEHRIATLDAYIRHIWKTQTSRNGVFGIEMNWFQFSQLGKAVNFPACFQNQVVWYVLRRRNLVAQAVSLFIADRTKVFHSYQVDKVGYDPEAIAYDPEQIGKNVTMLLNEERGIARYCTEQRITPVQLFYEEVVGDPGRALETFCNTLRVTRGILDAVPENPIRKIGGEANARLEARFRAEEATFLEERQAERPPLTHEIRKV